MPAMQDNTLSQRPETKPNARPLVDIISLALHRAVAVRLRQDADAVLSIARANLRRWLNRVADDPAAQRPWREWCEILEHCSPAEICELIIQDTDEGQRLRSATPFAGVLSQAERQHIWQMYEQAQLIHSHSAG